MTFLFSIIALILSIIALSKVNRIESAYSKTKENISPSIPNTITKVDTKIQNNFEEPQSSSKVVYEKNNDLDIIGNFVKWFSHEWPLKMGAFLILLAFIWLVTYAFLNNWIGPVGRITLGLLSGTSILYGGFKRFAKYKTQGITLVWLGSAIMVISVYAAQHVYSMFIPLVALSLVMCIILLTASISIKYHSFSLALATLVISSITPIIIGGSSNNIFGLFSYLLVLSLGILWFTRHTKWNVLTFLSLIVVSLYSVQYFTPYRISYYTPIEVLTLKSFAATFVSIYFFATILSIITHKKATNWDLYTALLLGFISYGWINGLVGADYKSYMVLLVSLFFAFGAYFVFLRTQLKQTVYLYTAVSLILLSIATALEFNGPILVIAFAIQAAIIPIVLIKLLGTEITNYIALYYILPLLFSISSLYPYNWRTGLFHKHFFAILIITLSFFSSGIYLYYSILDKTISKTKNKVHNLSLILIIIAGIYGLTFIWRVVHAIISLEYAAQLIILSTYTVTGLICYITGRTQNRKILNRFGIGVIVFVLVRLLLVEVWDMQLSGRIITFFSVGTLLMVSVLIEKTNKKLPSNIL